MNRVLLIAPSLLLMVACNALPDEEDFSPPRFEQALQAPSTMAHFSKVLDVSQGFNFDKDKQDKVGGMGFLTSLKIGGQELEADLLTIKDPENPTAGLDGGAVAVLSSFDWNTGSTDAISLHGQVSTANRASLAQVLQGMGSNTEVEFTFSIYEYEPSRRSFVKTVYADRPLRGLIERTGSMLNVDVADDPSNEVQSPQNYSFRIGIKPKSEDQEIHMVVGTETVVTMRWGVTEKRARTGAP